MSVVTKMRLNVSVIQLLGESISLTNMVLLESRKPNTSKEKTCFQNKSMFTTEY
jgi:hypothetical protein